ncbi:non-specific lipid-transfer protein 1-like [Malania oleifera]|uniref:non-specific lipid-transfer protein 1-like n=1 Tax=Malania oleifera TaxID=397392 RepID=UPI0025AE1841|nr:non-specific lipid-transfer protein 1-like [Malania oleifera]
MAGGAVVKVACLVALVVFVAASTVPEAEAAVTCSLVSRNVAPCINYLRKGGVVPPPCCAGIRGLNSAARTPADRKAACGCLKSAAGSIPGINFGLANALPSRCGVRIPYKISPTTDCSKVN